MKACIALATLTVLAIACSPRPASSTASPEAAAKLKTVADDYFNAFVESFPIGATFSGVPDAPRDRLGGLHILGWSRQQAIDYIAKHLVYPRSYIESEVDRYIADPGQATAYMIGRLEIERLRAQAMQKLGSRFDVRRFHDHVLENGSVPLTLLRADIERWIAAR